MPVLPSQWKNDKVLTDEERMVFAALEMEDDQLLMHAIEEKGASLNCKDFHGNIPLHYVSFISINFLCLCSLFHRLEN